MYNLMKYVLIYLIAVNVVAFFMYGIDKFRARKNLWRIPEKTLILSAVFGGSIGALLGMQVFHHKTKKPKFYIGVPMILMLQVAILAWLYYRMQATLL